MLAKELFTKKRDPWISVKGDTIYFKQSPQKAYYIDFERIDTREKLLDWIQHLVPKSWVTKETIFDLIWFADQEFDLTIHSIQA